MHLASLMPRAAPGAFLPLSQMVVVIVVILSNSKTSPVCPVGETFWPRRLIVQLLILHGSTDNTIWCAGAYSLLRLASVILLQLTFISLPPPSFKPFLIAEIRAELSRWTNTWQMDKWNPSLAVPFSYWLLQNLPLTCVQKGELLKIDHVVQRLRACLHFIRSVRL